MCGAKQIGWSDSASDCLQEVHGSPFVRDIDYSY
jgi:hypothetical protein